jgi:hypothetical protein
MRKGSPTNYKKGSDDTYGGPGQGGGASTGRSGEYGTGSGRTGQQESGGYGGDSSYKQDTGGYGGDSSYKQDTGGYGDSGNTGTKDSTTGKLMEKAGGLFGSKSIEEKGRAKREDAGGYGGSDDTSGNY